MYMIFLANSSFENSFYHDWECLTVVSPFIVALIAGIWFVCKRDDSEARRALLSIKEGIATMFMQTVIFEAHCLMRIVVNYLPDALSQICAEEPRKTRFDNFCAALRKLPEEDIDTDRGKYAFIIRDSFSQILQSEIERVIKAADPSSQTIANRFQNVTGLSFSLEGQTELKLVFLARRTAQAEQREKLYHVSHKLALFAFIFAVIGGFLFLVPAFWVKAKWGFYVSQVSLSVFFVLGIAGLLAMLIFVNCETNLKRGRRECEEDPGFQKAFEIWKGRGK